MSFHFAPLLREAEGSCWSSPGLPGSARRGGLRGLAETGLGPGVRHGGGLRRCRSCSCQAQEEQRPGGPGTAGAFPGEAGPAEGGPRARSLYKRISHGYADYGLTDWIFGPCGFSRLSGCRISGRRTSGWALDLDSSRETMYNALEIIRTGALGGLFWPHYGLRSTWRKFISAQWRGSRALVRGGAEFRPRRSPPVRSVGALRARGRSSNC